MSMRAALLPINFIGSCATIKSSGAAYFYIVQSLGECSTRIGHIEPQRRTGHGHAGNGTASNFVGSSAAITANGTVYLYICHSYHFRALVNALLVTGHIEP